MCIRDRFSANPSQIFKAMPANMVKNIEVITNPGAKYDAEGTGGVLNIVLNKMCIRDRYNKVRARKKAETFSKKSNLKTWLTANFSVTLHSKKNLRQTRKE